MVKHTKTPWQVGPERENDTSARLFSGSRYIGAVWNSDENINQARANAEHIVRCVNAHDALVAALRDCVREIRVMRRVQRCEFIDSTACDAATQALRDAGVDDESEVTK